MYFSYARQQQILRTKILLGSFCMLGLLGATCLLAVGLAKSEAPALDTQTSETPLPMTQVLVPIRDIEAGEILSPSMFKTETMLSARVSPQALRSTEQVIHQYARSYLVMGEPIHKKLIVSSLSDNPITRHIKPGQRLVTIRVNDITSVDGFVRPGDYVDVSWIHTASGVPSLQVITQRAYVVGADRNVDTNWKASMPVPGTVTLMVQNRDSRIIQLAMNNGTLSLALRADEEFDPEAASPLKLTDIVGNQPKKVTTDCASKLRSKTEHGTITWCIRPDGSLDPLESPSPSA